MRSLALGLTLFLLSAAPDGEKAPDFTLPDLEGRKHSLSDFKGKKVIVLIFGGIECPRSRFAEPRLGDMAAKYGAKGAAFVVINSNWNESVEEVAKHVKAAEFPIPVLKDVRNRVADRYKIETQPTALVLDGEFRIRYRGMIDDHKNEEFVRNHYLRDALVAVLDGREVKVKSTRPQGCFVRKISEDSASTEVTYARDVAPILNAKCVSCHRPGQVGPFSLTSYEQAKAWSAEIKLYTKTKFMPPWKPVTNRGQYYNERRLTDVEIQTLADWHKVGAPLGDADKVPPPPTFADGWMYGTPDKVIKAESGYVVGAKGPDEYRCYVIKNPFDKDVWLSAVEFRPGNMRVVHHIIAYLETRGRAAALDRRDPAPGYKSNGSGPLVRPSGSIGGWAPGNMPRVLPEGVGRRLRKGETIILETHYHKTGRRERDEGHEVAFYLAKKPVKKMLYYHMIVNPLFRIPAGAEDHRVRGQWLVPRNITALDVMPHMHLLGRKIAMWARLPDGKEMDLVRIEDWDFNWQETYQFKKPLKLPRGTKVRLEAHYDNSEGNPQNPTIPPKEVGWGEETTDEMCIGFVGFTIDREDRTKSKKK